jgi:hypothetical protein
MSVVSTTCAGVSEHPSRGASKKPASRQQRQWLNQVCGGRAADLGQKISVCLGPAATTHPPKILHGPCERSQFLLRWVGGCLALADPGLAGQCSPAPPGRPKSMGGAGGGRGEWGPGPRGSLDSRRCKRPPLSSAALPRKLCSHSMQGLVSREVVLKPTHMFEIIRDGMLLNDLDEVIAMQDHMTFSAVFLKRQRCRDQGAREGAPGGGGAPVVNPPADGSA